MKRGRNQGNNGPNSAEVTKVRIVGWKTPRHFLLLQTGSARPGTTSAISEPHNKCSAFNRSAFKYTSGSVRCRMQLKLLISSFYGLWLFFMAWVIWIPALYFLLTAVNNFDMCRNRNVLCKRLFVLPALYQVERPGRTCRHMRTHSITQPSLLANVCPSPL